jgi:hypothetical protein
MGPHMMEKEDGSLCNSCSFMTGNEQRYLRETTNYNPNNIMLVKRGRETTQKVHGNEFPWKRRNWESLVHTMLTIRWITL